MKTWKRMVWCLAAACFTTAFAAGADLAQAADWPKKTIKILVPYTAGGGADLMARAISSELSKKLGVSVVVENNPGGGGGIAMAKLVRSKPDGYTIILTTIGAATLTPNSSNVGYSDKEFAPIAQLTDVPNVIAVHKESGISSMAAYLDKAKTKPGSVTYGTSGAGLTQNVQIEAMLMNMKASGLITHVPFDGGSQAASALLGQQVDACVAIVPELRPNIMNGAFTGLAITSSERYSTLPDLPTLKELGYGIEGGVWYGLAAPAGTPKVCIDTLDKAVNEVLNQPGIVEIFANLGNPVQYLNSADFSAKWLKNFAENKAVLESMRNDPPIHRQ